MQSAQRSRGRAGSRKVKSKELVDDIASDDSNKDHTTAVSGTAEAAAADGKRKRQTHKPRPNAAVVSDSKLHRKRHAKNKVLLRPCVCEC